MFSLIIAIVAIALIVAVTLVGNYYGGSTISEAEAQAEAVRLKNEESQILAAIDAFSAQNGRFPQNLDELVTGRFLSTVPQGVREHSAAAKLDLISAAFAQSTTLGWSTPVAGQPILVTSTSVPHEVCRKYNLVSRGDDGILKQPFSSLPAQCYGSDSAYRIVVTKTGAVTALPSAVAPAQVLHGGVPAKDTGDIWWETAPNGSIKAPVDESKVRFAELELHPTTAEDFGDLQVGLTRLSAGRTVINSGNIAAESVSIQAPDGFRVASNSCTSGLAPGASCSFAVSFEPSRAQPYSGDVSVDSNNAGASRFPVQGVGHAARGELSSISFGNLAAGSSVVRDATLRNRGVGPLTLGAPRASGDGFAVAAGGSCTGTLAAGSTCTVRVSYSAVGLAGSTGTVTVPTTEAGDISASLSGQSQEARLSVDPVSRAFGAVQVGQMVVGDLHTVSNSGNIALSGLSVTPPAGFSIVDSSCSSSLAAGASCVFSVRFAPLEAEPYGGDVSVSSGNAGARTVAISGEGRTQSATLTLPSFGDVPAGSQTDRTATLTNTGVGPLTVTVPSQASLSGAGFSFLSTSCTPSLPSGSSCNVNLRFSASGIAAGSGTLTVNTGAGAKTTALQGQSQQAVLTADVSSLDFGGVQTGQKPVKPVTLRNTGNIAATNLAGAKPTGYSLTAGTPACTTSLAPNASCAVNVVFEPSAVQSYSGNYTVTGDNITTVNVPLTGSGVSPAATLSNIDFGNRNAGVAVSLVSTLTNTGVGPLSVVAPTAASVTGTGFAFVGTNCTTSIAVGASCDTTVRYTASAQASATGALTISTGAGSKVAALSGQSQQAVLGYDNSARAFGPKQVGTSSTTASHAVTNQGNVPMTNLVISGLPGFNITDNTCPTTLPAGGQCGFTITFAPVAAQAYSGNVQISTSNAGNGLVPVSGNGVAPQATLASIDFGGQAAGNSGTASSRLNNSGIGPLSVVVPTAASVTGAGFSFVSTTCTDTLAAGTGCSTTVRYNPTGTAAATGSLTISTSAGTKVASLSGQSQQSVLSLAYPNHTPGVDTLKWYDRQVGSTQRSSMFTLTNQGNIETATLSFPVSNAAWQRVGSNCPSTLSAGASCNFYLDFTPTAAQVYAGTVQVTAPGSTSSGTFSLSGTGTNAALALASVAGGTDLGFVGQGSDSGRWPVWRNAGAGSLEIRGHSSSNAAFWAWQGTTDAGYCYIGKVLAAGEQCSFFFGIGGTGAGDHSSVETVTYRAVGTTADRTATQTYTANVRTTTSSVPSLGFGNAALNTWSTAQTIRLTNNASANPVRNLSVSISGAHPSNFRILSNGCGAAIGAGASCDITVQFNPTWAANGFQAQVNIQGGYPRMDPNETTHIPNTGVNLTIPLSGNAAFSQATLTSASSAGQTAWYGEADKTFAFTYRNDGNATMTLASPSLSMPLFVAGNSCSGVGAGASCTLTVGLRSTGAGAGGSSSQTFVPSGATTAPAVATATWSIFSAIPRWAPASADFGTLAAGASASRTVTLYNDGSVAYNWTATLANLPAGVTANMSACSNVAPWGGSCQVTFTWTAQANTPIDRSGITPPAYSYQVNTMRLYGTVAAGATYNANQFQVQGGGCYECAVTVRNLTGANLTVTSVKFIGDADEYFLMTFNDKGYGYDPYGYAGSKPMNQGSASWTANAWAVIYAEEPLAASVVVTLSNGQSFTFKIPDWY